LGYCNPRRDNPVAAIAVSAPFMVLQACIDDSGEMRGPIFVLGGLLADSSAWEKFSSEWADELKTPIELAYVKAAEASGLRDQFSIGRGWDRQKRDDRIISLCGIIKRHAQARLHVSVDVAKFQEIALPVNQKYNNHNGNKPYWLLFHKIILQIIVLQCVHDGIPLPVDFIFDEQGALGDESRRSMADIYNMLKSMELPNGKRPVDFMGADPTFENDQNFLPLQAADLYAWSVSREFRQYDPSKPDEPSTVIFQNLQQLPTVQFHYGAEELTSLISDQPAWF
jgi:hypothetical protein